MPRGLQRLGKLCNVLFAPANTKRRMEAGGQDLPVDRLEARGLVVSAIPGRRRLLGVYKPPVNELAGSQRLFALAGPLDSLRYQRAGGTAGSPCSPRLATDDAYAHPWASAN